MPNSRRIGADAEREARDMCRIHWFASECVRNGQTSGDVCADLGNALPYTHVEVKRRSSIGAFRFLEQAIRDARSGELPVVLMRERGRKRWVVCFDMERTADFVARYLQAQEAHRGRSRG